MSENVLGYIERNGVNVTPQPILIQMDEMSPQEEGGYQSGEPRTMFSAYCTQLPIADPFLVRQGDHVVDASLILNPYTKAPRRWIITSFPEAFQDYHWEWQNELPRGL